MIRSGRTTALCLAGVASLALAAAAFAGRDQLIEAWHLRRLASPDFTVRFHAARRLGELRSARAVPGLIALLDGLEAHDAAARRVWGPGATAAGSVVQVLADIGAPAVPQLARALEESRDERVAWRRLACRAIATIRDPAAVDALAGLLGDGHPCLRLQAIQALGALGPEARAAIPALTAASQDVSPLVRKQAGEALARIGGESVAAR